MTKKDWSINLLIVAGVWSLDFLTKQLALEHIRGLSFWGPIGFVLHFNPGAMLGAFSDLPPVLRIVTLSTGGAFLICIYLAIQYLIPAKTRILRYGMSILLGGVLGNVTDRIFQGAVTDFLLIGTLGASTPAFNLADAVQWVGYGMIVYCLFKDGSTFWPEVNARRSLWVNSEFQKKYIGTLIVMGIGFALISGVFFFTYLKITIDALVVGSPVAVEKKFLVPFFITFSIISLGFLLLLFIVGRHLSHRTAGPLYAFEKFLEDILNGKDRELKLRAGDDFLHLEELSIKLRQSLNKEAAAVSTEVESP